MTSLVSAALYFVGIHVFVSGSGLRDRIVARTGERGFLGLFSLLSLAGMVWLVRAYAGAPYVELWGPAPWLRPVALVLVLLAFLLVVVGLSTPSPTATGGERVLDGAEPAAGILRVTRHPFLTGVALWAAIHILASGDLASVVLFGTMLALGVVGPGLIDRKRARRLGVRWERFASATSVVPFVAIAQGRNRFVPAEIGAVRVVAACAAYAAFLAAHAALFGVSPLAF